MNANSEFTWATADTVLVYKLFVFHSSWILGQYERNIVLTYILRASSLSCQDKIILFHILRFFGVEESMWSGIANPFSDSPKETHPFGDGNSCWKGSKGSNIANHAWSNNHLFEFENARVIDKGNYRRSARLWNPGILRKPSMPMITQNRCLGNIPFFYDYHFKFTFSFHEFFTAYFYCLLVFWHIYCLYLKFSLSILVFDKGYRLVAESLPF